MKKEISFKFTNNRRKRIAVAAARIGKFAFCLAILLFVTAASGSDRFPRPEFQSGYEIPPNELGGARAQFQYYVDVTMLLAALCVAAYLVFKKRSRKGIMALMLFSIVYFGFYKKGCVCSLGSIQNITAAVSSNYQVSITVFLIFALPLIFSLFFGRIFCSAVCPMGALQDIAALKPQKVPARVSAVLGFIPHIYLGLAIIFAATGGGFLICKYDPFVGIFRLSAPFGMMLVSVGILLLGVFIARPYCRYLCPYGVILGWLSVFSKYRVKISSGACVSCRLCKHSCPTDAILPPTTEPVKEERSRSLKRLKTYIVMILVLIIAGGAAGWFTAGIVSSFHPDVKLLRIVERDRSGAAGARSFVSEGLRVDDEVIAILTKQSDAARKNIKWGMIILGAYLGVVAGAGLIRRSTFKKRACHEADPVTCVACGRCYGYCPTAHPRLEE